MSFFAFPVSAISSTFLPFGGLGLFCLFLFGFGQLRWHLTTLRSQHTNYNPQSPFVSTKEVKQLTYNY